MQISTINKEPSNLIPGLFLGLIGFFVVGISVSDQREKLFRLLVVPTIIVSDVWVAVDAWRHGLGLLAKSQQLGLTRIDRQSPAAWFFECLLLWIVAFPVYFAKRRKLILAAATERR